MKINFKDRSVLTLIIVNLFPLVGVIVLNWDLFEIVTLYVAETVVVGIDSVIRMLFVRKEAKKYVMFVFIFVYGLFVVFQLFFVVLLLGTENVFENGPKLRESLQSLIYLFNNWDFIFAITLVIINQGYSSFKDFFKQKKYLQTTKEELTTLPFKRLGLQHFIIVVGMVVSLFIGNVMGFLFIFVLLKTLIDVISYQKINTQKPE